MSFFKDLGKKAGEIASETIINAMPEITTKVTQVVSDVIEKKISGTKDSKSE